MSQLTIDDCASYTHVDCYILCAHDWLLAEGDQPNSKSGKKAAGHNTDGFDCSTTKLTIQDRSVSFSASGATRSISCAQHHPQPGRLLGYQQRQRHHLPAQHLHRRPWYLGRTWLIRRIIRWVLDETGAVQGSISSDVTVSGIVIRDNIIQNKYALVPIQLVR